MIKGKESLEKLVNESTDHRYKETLDWVLDRARHYAEKTGLTPEEVIEAWEKDRSYSLLNYYQDCNQPLLDSEKIIKYDDWISELKKRFGNESKEWAFKCPSCGNVQTGNDFLKHKVEDYQNRVYFSCLGRYVKDVGCNWTLGGLLSIHKVSILKGVRVIPVFEMADCEVKA